MNRLTIDDKTKVVIDPCCGTGTIIDQAYKLKEEYELNQEEIIDSIWASDKHSFPVQLSTLSMAKPSNIGKIINIFTSDVIDLQIGKVINFRNPNNGDVVSKTFPTVDYVVSNLPFIKSKEMKVLNPNIIAINEWIQENANTSKALSGKSDIFAYIPFYLYNLLAENGKIGLILSNAWLGTDYGEVFLKLFQEFYKVEYVVISGKGKWFNNADVVTTLLIASKKIAGSEIDNAHEISFCTLKENIEDIQDIKALSEDIVLSNSSDNITINKYSLSDIINFENIGIPWSGYFCNLNWLEHVTDKLVPISNLFETIRGERRGWNPMFYPASGHNIESNYIKPVLKNLRITKGLIASTNKEAFCCSESIDNLDTLGHAGSIAWIRSFENQNNNNGIPLTKSLQRNNHYWYEMKSDSMAEFVANINYDNTLFIAKLESPSFIDQRLIGISVKDSFSAVDKTLILALLNSTISMFFLESLGFGRGLGTLDLNKTKFENNFNLLNPTILTTVQKTEIIEAFNPLLERNRLPLLEELESNDRIIFENTLMEAYGISAYYEPIKNSLKELFKIRFAVKN